MGYCYWKHKHKLPIANTRSSSHSSFTSKDKIPKFHTRPAMATALNVVAFRLFVRSDFFLSLKIPHFSLLTYGLIWSPFISFFFCSSNTSELRVVPPSACSAFYRLTIYFNLSPPQSDFCTSTMCKVWLTFLPETPLDSRANPPPLNWHAQISAHKILSVQIMYMIKVDCRN